MQALKSMYQAVRDKEASRVDFPGAGFEYLGFGHPRNDNLIANDPGSDAVCLRGAASPPARQVARHRRGGGACRMAVIGAARVPSLAKLHDAPGCDDAGAADARQLSHCLLEC